MSDLAHFEYALVLLEEEIVEIAKECLAMVIGEGHEDAKELKPNSISESGAQMLTKVQQLLTRPDSRIHLIKIMISGTFLLRSTSG